MKYYFRLDDADRRENAILHGRTPKPIRLYKETPDMVADFESEDGFEWWPVWKFGDFSWNAGDFESEDEAVKNFEENEGEQIYCKIHDC